MREVRLQSPATSLQIDMETKLELVSSGLQGFDLATPSSSAKSDVDFDSLIFDAMLEAFDTGATWIFQ